MAKKRIGRNRPNFISTDSREYREKSAKQAAGAERLLRAAREITRPHGNARIESIKILGDGAAVACLASNEIPIPGYDGRLLPLWEN